MRRQQRPLEIRRMPPPPPAQARMDAYWWATPEELYGSIGVRPPPRPRSLSFQTPTSGYFMDEFGGYCVHHPSEHGLTVPQYPPPPPPLLQPRATTGPFLDVKESMREGHYVQFRRNKNKGFYRSDPHQKNLRQLKGQRSRDECLEEQESKAYSDSEDKDLPPPEEGENEVDSWNSSKSPDSPPETIRPSSSSSSNRKRPTKLKRRKAYYKDRKEGRSRSLTHIDTLDPAMLLRQDVDSRSEPDTSQETLLVPTTPNERHMRRKKLARSQVSSSEFFSVCFENEHGCEPEEFFPATRGTTLGDAIRPFLYKKHLTMAKVDIFVDSSKTPLPSPATTDTYFVAGKNLILKAKEHDSKFHCRSFKQPSRKVSQRSKGKFFSASSEDPNYLDSPTGSADILETPSATAASSTQTGSPGPRAPSISASMSHEGSLKVKLSKQSNRWGGLFSNSPKDNTKMDLLVEQLNNYSKNGIPKWPGLPGDEDDEGIYTVEEDVRSLVSGWSLLSERGRQQQTAIWELVETEVVYLRTIKVITDLFLACLYNLQTANILNEIDREELFSNIPSIYVSNRSLWLDCLFPMVQKSRRTREPLQPTELHSGFLRFGTICEPYIRYCLDQTKCQRYCRDKYHENELFKAYLAWCETRKECNRLKLMDILVRPMQRMTKYSLLLKAILKHTEDPDQRTALDEMILSVERFVKSVNGALRSRQDAERLQGIADRIEAYDVVETREEELEVLVKCHSRLDLFHPMPGCGTTRRGLLFEGDLKVKDANTKIDAHCFLFTDMLLICKAMGRKGEKMKVIRPPFVVDRLLMREFSKDPNAFGLLYLNEYATASAALTLHASESKTVRVWIDHITKAQKLYAEAKRSENSEYPPEILDEEDGTGVVYLSSRSPRDGSSRASQFSSLVHSNSGSVEMNEASNISSRGVSFEHEHRGSSLSSDDGNGGNVDGAHKHRPVSPRTERRMLIPKSPNTLSVQVPVVGNLSGQSLPNLSAASESLPHTFSINSLVVPKALLSPTHRGISYPPPSPRNLRRSEALPARNPPLSKSQNIHSVEAAKSLDVPVPYMKGTTSASIETSPISNSCVSIPASITCSPEAEIKESHVETVGESSEIKILHSNPEVASGNPSGGPSRRLARSERAETKRYHTAGAIEDIKKETLRDSSIYKRLSWNYGPHPAQDSQSRPLAADPFKNKSFFSNESMASIHSSSGVSSTTSLFHCVSDLDTTPETGSGSLPPRADVSINVSEPEPETCQFEDESESNQRKNPASNTNPSSVNRILDQNQVLVPKTVTKDSNIHSSLASPDV